MKLGRSSEKHSNASLHAEIYDVLNTKKKNNAFLFLTLCENYKTLNDHACLHTLDVCSKYELLCNERVRRS